MRENMFFRILSSIPVILIVLYFIPFLGVCLIIFRYFMYRELNIYKTPITLLTVGFILLIPKCLDFILKSLKIKNLNFPILETITTSNIYVDLLKFSKLLIILGVLCAIISYVVKIALSKASNKVEEMMQKDLQKDYEIRKENDIKMQEKREIAKNTHVVTCKYCGATNTLTTTTGVCKYCKKDIS